MDNKDIAQRLREMIPKIDVTTLDGRPNFQSGHVNPEYVKQLADELDPPKPKQGVCRFTWGNKTEWYTGLVVGEIIVYSLDGESTSWKPASECEIEYCGILTGEMFAN